MSTPAKPSQSNCSSISKVRVILRVRPFLPHEIAARNGNSTPCVSVLDSKFDSSPDVTVQLKDQETCRSECYKLDSFFGQEDNNVSKIFYREVSSLIPGIFLGFNATVFAYGATCSGKTYTMQGTDEIPGLIPLAMSTVLSMCQSTGSTAEISYYEVYMDRCYDLMEIKAQEIAVLEDKDGQIHLKGLSRVPVNSMPEFREAFSCGNQRRKVAHTGLNDVSSRSHGVLAITVSTHCGDGSGAIVTGKLNLIDLAGNEDNRRTCNEGIRLQESAKINQSLFALSNVIYALNNNQPRVPYRESKLTRILQDSLGGTSHALMVACLNPGEYQESLHTVSLAARSRHISNFVSSAQKNETPKVKIDMEAKLRAWLESKGKTKSAQRMGAFGSPFLSKALSSAKKPIAHHSSAKQKPNNNQGASCVKERASAVPRKNLFNNEGPVNSRMKDMYAPRVDKSEVISDDGGLRNISTAQSDGKIQLHMSNSLQVTAEDDGMETSPTTLEVASEDNIEEKSNDSANEFIFKSKTRTPDKLFGKVEKLTNVYLDNYDGSSPIGEKIKALQNSLRKVLSPINSNINIENMSSKDQICVVLLDPKTPKTPFLISCTGDKSQKLGTPLDKFNVLSSNLKSSLIQEYIDFLNQASREELMELKGIGQKMADYILELRETSPLKSLGDLEKIGLSSKQVHNMFNRTARGIFD
ncbi:kinesin-like protein KIN-10C [Actinidia eriantha]|uniref:kinesin-like protein KIN-10C n=1 Tax=Actinidia eriantha TaxID=165200 RepID=UPI0025828A70|nr:kinesin-like protein KIN-10C [Actinidia eriantha]